MTAVYAPSAFRVYIGFTGGPFTESPTWEDVSADFLEISSTRGRSGELDDFQAGSCTVTLNNRSRDYDPTYAASPYNGNVEPRRQIKIEVEADGGTYPVFRGVISSWQQTWSYDDGQTATIEAVDASSILASTPVDAIDTVDSVSDRITAILGATDLPVGLLSIGTGSSQVGPSDAGYAWPVASLAAASELGRLFVSATGTVYYQPPTDDFGAAPSVVFADDSTAGAIRYSGYSLTVDDRSIVNSCDVTGIDSSGRATDPASILAYGGAQRSVTSLLITNRACSGLAGTVVNRFSSLVPRGSSWAVTPTTEEELGAVSGVEIGQIAEITRTPPVGSAHTATVVITGVAVSASSAGASFVFSGELVDTTGFFRWGVSDWDGTHGWR